MSIETPKPQTGTWTLIAPNGRRWTGDSPLRACAAEMNDRVPPEIALKRIFDALYDEDHERVKK